MNKTLTDIDMIQLHETDSTRHFVIPIKDAIIFPGIVASLILVRNMNILAATQCFETDSSKCVVLIPQKDLEQAEISSPEEMHNIGVKCFIRQIKKLDNNTYKVLFEGLSRVSTSKIFYYDGVFSAEAQDLTSVIQHSNIVAAYRSVMLEQFKRLCSLSPVYDKDILSIIDRENDLDRIIDIISYYLDTLFARKIESLQIIELHKRAEYLIELIRSECTKIELENTIRQKTQSRMEKQQRDYYLSEQLKSISNELFGQEEDDIISLIDRINKCALPPESKERIQKELKRLKALPTSSPESSVVRTYIDTVLNLPWGIINCDDISLDKASKELDNTHYGQEKVKEAIMEYLAAFTRTKTIRGPILCLVGPPGVGKTSIASSLAKVLNRPLVRISLGGVRDEAEIRGTRRTYIGSMPGSIMNKIALAKSSSPVMVLDEIDKISSDFRGDPSSCLLELLDPTLNTDFRDHYIDLPFDLSKTVFVATANSFYNIQPALIDRLQVVELEGYDTKAKIKIAKDYVLPLIFQEHNIPLKQIAISSSVITSIIEQYTYESGVRGLKNKLEKLVRRVLLKYPKLDEPVVIKNKELFSYLGHKLELDHIPKINFNPIGIVNGLSWNCSGKGDLMRIESVLITGSGKIHVTGNLGSIMEESVFTAFTAVKKYISDSNIKINYDLTKSDLHVHFPEGAVPKDGPSAGIGIATAIFSSLTNKKVNKNIAMTGETTIGGYVLPIGGLREKLMAASKYSITSVILPIQNKVSISKLPQDILNSVNLIYVSHLKEVFKYSLTNE